MALPIIQDPSQSLMLMQRNWKSKIDPVLQGPNVNGKALTNIALSAGSTQIPHGLSGTQRGWYLTDIQGAATIFRSAPFDAKNLTLTSNVTVTISLWVF